jgi:hypothetical protein
LKKNEGEKGDQEILVEKNHRQRGREREERWEGGIDKKKQREERRTDKMKLEQQRGRG